MLEWAEHHKDDPVEEKEDDARNKKSTDIDEWDQKFMQVDQEMLFEIILVPTLPSPITQNCHFISHDIALQSSNIRLQIIWISSPFSIPDARPLQT